MAAALLDGVVSGGFHWFPWLVPLVSVDGSVGFRGWFRGFVPDFGGCCAGHSGASAGAARAVPAEDPTAGLVVDNALARTRTRRLRSTWPKTN